MAVSITENTAAEMAVADAQLDKKALKKLKKERKRMKKEMKNKEEKKIKSEEGRSMEAQDDTHPVGETSDECNSESDGVAAIRTKKAEKVKKRRRDSVGDSAKDGSESVKTEDADKQEKKRLKREKKRLKKLAKAEKQAQAQKEDKVSADAKKDSKEEKKAKKQAKKEKKEKSKSKENQNKETSRAIDTESAYSMSVAAKKLSTEVVQKYREENEISISGSGSEDFDPVLSFSSSGFSEAALRVCSTFAKPTPIQSQCWPVLSAGRDIVGIAETGSGKTLAFSLPAVAHIQRQMQNTRSKGKSAGGPVMLVVAPTRELAMQSADVIGEVGSHCGFSCTCIYGGVPKHAQRQTLSQRGGVQVVVATPGRLKDLMEEGACDLGQVSYLVLDEADRMLDEGFERDIRTIIAATASKRQTVMFSATWPESIQQLAAEFLNNPIKVTIGSEDLSANRRVTQVVEVVDMRARDQKLGDLLKKFRQQGALNGHNKQEKVKILVFVLYKKEAVRVEGMLQRKGWNCVAIHGDKSQGERTRSVTQFRSGSVPLLIATDVAARGLDIPDVEYVINYSFPLTIEDYIHRIGRTGRGGKTGYAHTFFHMGDKARSGELINVLNETEQEVPKELLKFGTHVKKKDHKLYGAFAKDVDMSKKATKITFGNSDEE